MEGLDSPDSDTREFANLYRAGGYVVIHHQYIRGRESEVILEEDKKDL